METKSFFGGLLRFSVFPGIPLVAFFIVLTVFLSLAFLKDTSPDVFEEKIIEALGLSGGTWNYMSADEEQTVMDTGLDPAIVANEILANSWINSNGGDIDVGIQYAILEGESGGGNNLGSCSGTLSALKFSQQEMDSAKQLLQYWKEARIRDWSEVARDMIKEDYSDYTGHCSAGEIGPNGILPSTGVMICERGLQSHPDDLVNSCNFFDNRVAPYAKVWWLKAIGYESKQSDAQKFDSLWGWNHSDSYRMRLIERAAHFNSAAGGWDFIPVSEKHYVYEGKFWRKAFLKILKFTELFEYEVHASNDALPGSTPPLVQIPISGGFVNPYPGSILCGYAYGVPVANGIHWGIDLCTPNWDSSPIYAMHSGEVTFARMLYPSEWLAGNWWISGNVVAIEGVDADGNKIWTAYGHGTDNTMKVSVGDHVEEGQFLMMSGTTGFSNGIHLHLAMKINDKWVNPALYLEGN